MVSPYSEVPVEGWQRVTQELVDGHPLKAQVLLDTALTCWRQLWSTVIGHGASKFKLADIAPPATIVGYFFEKLFARELALRLPGEWTGGVGSQKDLHCLTNEAMSVEMKSSGQMGYKIFGNRSYGQQLLENSDGGKKSKSGFYITINFYNQTLTLLRFGWIDATDWQAQKSATGQMAGLADEVYRYKLLPLRGDYVLDGPVQLVDGIGAGAAFFLAEQGVCTIRDLLFANEHTLSSRALRLKAYAMQQYSELIKAT